MHTFSVRPLSAAQCASFRSLFPSSRRASLSSLHSSSSHCFTQARAPVPPLFRSNCYTTPLDSDFNFDPRSQPAREPTPGGPLALAAHAHCKRENRERSTIGNEHLLSCKCERQPNLRAWSRRTVNCAIAISISIVCSSCPVAPFARHRALAVCCCAHDCCCGSGYVCACDLLHPSRGCDCASGCACGCDWSACESRSRDRGCANGCVWSSS